MDWDDKKSFKSGFCFSFATKALYFFATTGNGVKTLGEEYCDVWHVRQNEEKGHWELLSPKARAQLFVFQIGKIYGNNLIVVLFFGKV
jgi:hypothetical protein